MPYESGQLLFAVCSFQRIFDTDPIQDLLSLTDLVDGLTRFQLKPKLHKRIDRELSRIDNAWKAWERDRSGGTQGRKFEAAYAEAESQGEDGTAAAAAMVRQLRSEAKKRAKKEFRVWSPTLYEPGARRGGDGVVEMSCLVLDYDSGVSIDEARDVWAAWFHIVHTTWSHRPEHHKFRVVLPLLNPIPATQWPGVWSWVEDRTAGTVDTTTKSVSHAYALPVVPHPSWPRQTHVHEADLLDLMLEQVVDEVGTTQIDGHMLGHCLLHPDTDHDYVPGDSTIGPTTLESEEVWDMFADPAPPVETQWDVPAGAPDVPGTDPKTAESRLAAAEARIAALESGSWVDELERVSALFERGLLSDEEFLQAKRRLLAGNHD